MKESLLVFLLLTTVACGKKSSSAARSPSTPTFDAPVGEVDSPDIEQPTQEEPEVVQNPPQEPPLDPENEEIAQLIERIHGLELLHELTKQQSKEKKKLEHELQKIIKAA